MNNIPDFEVSPINLTSELPKELSFAIAYVPYQVNPSKYSSEEALEKGTLFPALYKPFTGKRGAM
ncbi:MAG: spore coat associated protein CotJA [Clostridia bacterium]|nr:spore coat associated protein CotJA [Clostridia bacterium]